MTQTGALDEPTGDALAELYVRSTPAAMRVAYFLTGRRDAAEDLVHDAFVRAVSRYRDLRDPASFDAYLRRTVVNLHTSRMRRRRVERRYLAAQPRRVPTVDPPRIEDRDLLLRALSALPPRQRAAVVLRFCEDLTEDETARILRTSVVGVNSLVRRAMTTLRSVMEDER
ncbi:MAG: RNA polymerase sigma factor [Planctomycetaceae bacterium]